MLTCFYRHTVKSAEVQCVYILVEVPVLQPGRVELVQPVSIVPQSCLAASRWLLKSCCRAFTCLCVVSRSLTSSTFRWLTLSSQSHSFCSWSLSPIDSSLFCRHHSDSIPEVTETRIFAHLSYHIPVPQKWMKPVYRRKRTNSQRKSSLPLPSYFAQFAKQELSEKGAISSKGLAPRRGAAFQFFAWTIPACAMYMCQFRSRSGLNCGSP